MATIDKHYMILYKEKSGEIITTLSGLGTALMELYLLEHVKKGLGGAIFHASTGLLHAVYSGMENDIKICKGDTLPCRNINDMCDGLLDALNNDPDDL